MGSEIRFTCCCSHALEGCATSAPAGILMMRRPKCPRNVEQRVASCQSVFLSKTGNELFMLV